MTSRGTDTIARYIVKFQYEYLAINEIFSQLLLAELGLPGLQTGIVVLGPGEKRTIPVEICQTGIPVAIEYIQRKPGQDKFDFPNIETASLRKTMLQYILLDIMANFADKCQVIEDESGRLYRLDCAEQWIHGDVMHLLIHNAKKQTCSPILMQIADTSIVCDYEELCSYMKSLHDRYCVNAYMEEQEAHLEFEATVGELMSAILKLDEGQISDALEPLRAYYPTAVVDLYCSVADRLKDLAILF
jgi:hypothetical protein